MAGLGAFWQYEASGKRAFKLERQGLCGRGHPQRVFRGRVCHVLAGVRMPLDIQGTPGILRFTMENSRIEVGFQREVCPFVIDAGGEQNCSKNTEPPVG